jgi:hypothetical protein
MSVYGHLILGNGTILWWTNVLIFRRTWLYPFSGQSDSITTWENVYISGLEATEISEMFSEMSGKLITIRRCHQSKNEWILVTHSCEILKISIGAHVLDLINLGWSVVIIRSLGFVGETPRFLTSAHTGWVNCTHSYEKESPPHTIS